MTDRIDDFRRQTARNLVDDGCEAMKGLALLIIDRDSNYARATLSDSQCIVAADSQSLNVVDSLKHRQAIDAAPDEAHSHDVSIIKESRLSHGDSLSFESSPRFFGYLRDPTVCFAE